MALFLQACGSSSASAVNETVEDTKNTALTIMYYGDADNNLEPYLLKDVAEMKAGYSGAGYNLITLHYLTRKVVLQQDLEKHLPIHDFIELERIKHID